mmetsp:Transcript_30227/g.89765  ORF Transcript_30227/g.89765 Transcript_30227/m.89765 type:complete len:284 (-) Transcript_30227:208-1059(-)
MAPMRPRHGGPLFPTPSTSQSAPVLPKIEDLYRLTWKPPPRKEEIRAMAATQGAKFKPPFEKYFRQGDGFGETKFLRHGKDLDFREASRALMPERSYARLPGVIRYGPVDHPLPEPTEEMTIPRQREWLARHRKERDRHIYPVYYARRKVEVLKQKEEDRKRSREITRQLLEQAKLGDRPPDAPELSANATRGLQKLKLSVKAMRPFKSTVGAQMGDEAEVIREREALEKAKADPVLQIGMKWDPGRPTHLRPWAAQDMATHAFQDQATLRYPEPKPSRLAAA